MKLELSDFSNVVQVPTTFEVVRTSIDAVDKIMTAWPYMASRSHNTLVLCGSGGTTRAMANDYIELMKSGLATAPRVQEISFGNLAEARQVDALCAELDIDLLVAIGGGRVIDTAKYVAFQRKVALLCMPSVLSSDGITSPVSVLGDGSGQKRSLPSGIPSCVIVDLSLTMKAPLLLTKAGVGDLLSNASALLDLEDYEAAGNGPVSGFGKLLSYSAYQSVLRLTEDQIMSPDGQETIAKGLILSGLSMAFTGNSMPCSGAEHLISHAIDSLGIAETPHGLQVAVATLYCLALRKTLDQPATDIDMRSVMAGLNLPCRPEDIGVSRPQFIHAVEIAPTMRDRKCTILHADRGPSTLAQAYDLAFA